MTESIVIEPDGSVRRQKIATYEQLNKTLGGYIEAAPTDGSLTLWVNEEGKVKGLPDNPKAQELWRLVDGYGCTSTDWLAGTVVVQGPANDEGDTTDCPKWVMDKYRLLNCPRCNGEMPSHPGALSRTDNETEICSECGIEEAMIDFMQMPLDKKWPVSRNAE